MGPRSTTHGAAAEAVGACLVAAASLKPAALASLSPAPTPAALDTQPPGLAPSPARRRGGRSAASPAVEAAPATPGPAAMLPAEPEKPARARRRAGAAAAIMAAVAGQGQVPGPTPPAQAAQEQSPARRRGKAVASAAAATASINASASTNTAGEAPADAPLSPAPISGTRKHRRAAASAAAEAPVAAAAAAGGAAADDDDVDDGEGPGDQAPAKRRTRQRKAAGAAAAAEGEAAGGEGGEGEPKKQRKARMRREISVLPFTDPTPELLASLAGRELAPLPVPNLGYACLNMTLRSLNPPIFTSRDCIKKTLDAKGLPYLGELCLANCRDLARLVQWNAENGIRLFRMSSVLFPWMGTFDFHDLPNHAEISAALRFAGDLARAHGQRLTFHPSHFCKLAAPDAALAAKTRRELEAHSQILDLMGYEPSPWNKVNIHVGGVYGDKQATLQRFADSFARLSPACRARLTVENDDVASSFSLNELLELHRMTGVPLVFDFHHHKFNTGGLSEEEAFRAAVATWPAGVRPVVHWSESQAGRKPHAHSDYVRGPIFLHGLEGAVDVMIEAKCKEQALLCYRDGLPIPEPPAAGEEAEEEGGGE